MTFEEEKKLDTEVNVGGEVGEEEPANLYVASPDTGDEEGYGKLRLRHKNLHTASSSSKEENADTEAQEDSSDRGDEKTDDDKEKEDDTVQEEKLANTTFSLLFISKSWSKAYIYSLVVICFQLVIVLAAILDSLDLQNPGNPGSFPSSVSTSVTVAQAAVIPLAVASQKDVIEALVRIHDSQNGHQHFELSVRSIRLALPSHRFQKWFLSSVSQLVVGVGILVCVFLFTMQAGTVFKVLINFVALFLVSNISGVAYEMANRGFLGQQIWKDAVKVSQHVVKRRYNSTWPLQLAFILCTTAMYIGFGVVKNRQLSGYYLCNAVYVQFEDSFQLSLPFLSGVYNLNPRSDNIGDRFTYTDAHGPTGRFQLAYCASDQVYGVSDHRNWTDRENTARDPCMTKVVSQQTYSFDVLSTSQSPWRVYSERDNSLVGTKSLVMQCVDCSPATCQPHRGDCVNNKCVCKDGRFGIRCQFRAPCDKIVTDANLGGFPPISSILNEDYVVLDTEYDLFQDANGTYAQAYNRPVYVSENYRYMIFYSGMRWVIVSPLLAIEQDASFPELEQNQIGPFFFEIFQTYVYDTLVNANLQIFAMSEPVESGSYIDTGSPIGLQWSAMRTVQSGDISEQQLNRQTTYDALFICAHCEVGINPCHNFGVCNNNTRTCECNNGTVGFPLNNGALCERPITCDEAAFLSNGSLPTGCVGDYSCNVESGTCSCLNDYPDAGRFCQFLPCFSAYAQEEWGPTGCANGGRCSNITGSCICDDPFPGVFEGKYCQEESPWCSSSEAQLEHPPNGCAHDGVCSNETGFCECDIDGIFEGRYCESIVPACTDDTIRAAYPPSGCTNGGTCNNETGSCECPLSIFGGRYCQRGLVDCQDDAAADVFGSSGCDNNGVCDESTGYCECEEVFAGKFCQTLVNETSTSRASNTTNDEGLSPSIRHMR